MIKNSSETGKNILRATKEKAMEKRTKTKMLHVVVVVVVAAAAVVPFF